MNVDISGIDLTGQRAIVTGSDARLARSIAESLTESGAAVRLVVQTEDQRDALADLIDDTDGRFNVIVADTTNRIAVERTIQHLKDQSGFLTLLVNTVNITETQDAPWQIDPNDWSNTLEGALRAALLWTRATLPEMATGGRIINIAGLATFSRLMDSLAAEAKTHQIKLFAVDPTGLLSEPSNISDVVRQFILFLASGRADNLAGHFVELGNGVYNLVEPAMHSGLQ